MELARVRTTRRRGNPLRWMILLLLCIGSAVVTYYGWQQSLPNDKVEAPNYGSGHPILYNGKVVKPGAKLDGSEIMLPLTSVQQVLGEDVPIRYEEASQSLILTTSQKVLHMKTDALTATLNMKPIELQFAAVAEEGEVYIPLTPLTELYGLQGEVFTDTGFVALKLPGEVIQYAVVTTAKGSGAAIRNAPSDKDTIAENAMEGSRVRLLDESEGWYLVQGPAGYVGYADKSQLVLDSVEIVPEPYRGQPFIPWSVLGSKVNLTWEAVYSRPADYAKIGPMPGVNVVSPTWFELEDGKGNIKSKADKNYVSWAHGRNMQVWALFSNSFEPDRTTEVLSNYESRFTMIQQLLAYAQMYKLQGINIDFENVYTKDKDNFVQFVREFTPLAHEQELVVSVDVTPKSNSEMWSAFLDRKALGQIVDYMAVMTYDEHWASSPKAGSVASLPWVERSISRILLEDGVPSRKLLLGIPLYTRVWTETKQDDGTVKVSSKAIGMETADELVRSKKLTPVFDEAAGQHYVEYEENGALNRIWLEDETSVRARVELVKQYDLGGIATWARSFQKPAIWQVMDDGLNQRP